MKIWVRIFACRIENEKDGKVSEGEFDYLYVISMFLNKIMLKIDFVAEHRWENF